MAIAFDASSQGQNGGASATLTFSHTCSGSNRILFVNTGCHTSVATITGVTYNGVAMTSVIAPITSPDNFYMRLWYLLAPATGANNIVVTASATDGIAAQAASYTGAAQTTLDATASTTQNSTGSFTQSLTTVADNCWIVWGNYRGSSMTAGANTVVRQQDGVQYGNAICDTNSAQTPAGSKSMNCTAASGNWYGIIASFAPVSSISYSLVMSVGTLTLTGIAATLTSARSLIMDVGSFALTGIAASFRWNFNYVLSLATGLFSLTGFPLSFGGNGITTVQKNPGVLTTTNKSSPSTLTTIPKSS